MPARENPAGIKKRGPGGERCQPPHKAPSSPACGKGWHPNRGKVYPMGLGEITYLGDLPLSGQRPLTEQSWEGSGPSRVGAGGGSGDPGAARTRAPTRAALLGEGNLGYLGGVSSTESRSHWDLYGKPSTARAAGCVSPAGGSWMDPPSSIPTLVVQRSYGDPFWEKPIHGKEIFVKNILSVTSVCREGMPEIN